MKNVLWFSRHAMTVSQLNDLKRILGDVFVTQISGSPANVHVAFEAAKPEVGETTPDAVREGTMPPLKELITDYDEVAVVLPIGLLQQLLPFAKGGRLLQAISKRILLDEGKVLFSHDKWQAVKEIKIVTEDL